ncbi:hypothetical protein DFH11DRAFT_1800572 [Phellopilus nigrolimitatus]|nr:hypothetical protein DFH11DRAFT_1800572 [Phellopilus nigrolimitatus]
MSNDMSEAISLLKLASIPLYTSPTSLTWVLLDYYYTAFSWLSFRADAILFQKPGSMSRAKFLFLWIRYYTILLAVFDVVQIHSFAKFRPSLEVCVAMDSTIRVIGAISLWFVEIIMQLRIYALYNCSKRVAAFNIILFLTSIAGFLWILRHVAEGRAAVIRSANELPIHGCLVIHTGIEWAQWVPATIFEGVLFAFALVKSLREIISRLKGGSYVNGLVFTVIVNDNLLYFFGVTSLLVLNNLMVTNATHVPWFSYSPFHVAIGTMTSRMLLHLHKSIVKGRAVYSEADSEMQNSRALSTGPSQVLSTYFTLSWSCNRTETFVGSDDRHVDR